MPRVHSLTARKDYPEDGIKKGETYYKWKKRYGPVRRSSTYPRHSQLSNAKYAPVKDAIQDAQKAIGEAEEPDAIKDLVQEVADAAREAAEEYEEAISNMAVEGSPLADDMQEKADALNAFADACEEFDPDSGAWDDLGEEEPEDGEAQVKWREDREAALEDMRTEATDVLDGLEL